MRSISRPFVYFGVTLNGIHDAGESTLSEIISLYIVFSHLLTILIVYYSTRRVQNERKCDFFLARLLGLFQRGLSPAELRHPSGSPPPPHQSPLPPPPPPPTASPPAREPATAAVASPTAGQAVSLPSSSTGLRRVFNGEVGQLRQHLVPACRDDLASPSISRAKGLFPHRCRLPEAIDGPLVAVALAI